MPVIARDREDEEKWEERGQEKHETEGKWLFCQAFEHFILSPEACLTASFSRA